jgi:Beta protein
MSVGALQYVPVLKWRQAERQAVSRLHASEKDAIVPLFIVPPIEYDFEERREKRTLQEHLERFPDIYLAKWGDRRAFIDTHDSLRSGTMDNGEEATAYIFRELHSRGANAVPVLSRQSDINATLLTIVARDQCGVALRVDAHSLTSSAISDLAGVVVSKLRIDISDIDLILDLGKPENFGPRQAFAGALAQHINRIGGIDNYRSFALAMTAIDLSSVKKPGATLQRKEWLLYQELIAPRHALKRIPAFGDYAIETPNFAPDLDFRLISPAARIVYTVDSDWWVLKGEAFRDNPDQMTSMCKTVAESENYAGPELSWGDKRILETANGTGNSGNLTTWKQVGISHHLCVVVRQLASLHDSPSSF